MLFYTFESFSHQHQLMIFHGSLSDGKSPQVSRTLLSIQADLNNAGVWIVCNRVLISNYSSPFTNPSVTVPSAPITMGITVIFMFHRFSVPGTYLSFLLPSILLGGLSGRQSPLFGKFSVFIDYYLILLFILLFYSYVFHTSVSCWPLTGVWVAASPHKSQWLFW